MTFLTNWVFWAILGVIIVLMAIVGYLAEGTELLKKKDKKVKKEKVTEITTPTNPAPAQPSAWTGEVKKEDEHQEQVYTVPSINDWSTIPTVNETVNATPNIESRTLSQNMPFSNMNPNSITPNIQPEQSSNLVSELNAEGHESLTDNAVNKQPSVITPSVPSTQDFSPVKDNLINNINNNQNNVSLNTAMPSVPEPAVNSVTTQNTDALSTQPTTEKLENQVTQPTGLNTSSSVLSTQPVGTSVPLNSTSGTEKNNFQSADSIWK